MNKKRLLKLADLLEADAKNKKGCQFDLSLVGEASDFSTDPTDPFVPGLNCGTSACAMDLAAISGAFKRTGGLSYRVKGSFIEITINGRARTYDRAAMAVFDIDIRTADFLFPPSAYWNNGECTPRGAACERRVATRIRDLVAGRVSA